MFKNNYLFNKGFTLVELLSVIALLGIISILAIPNFTSILKSSKEDLYNKQIEVIKVSAKLWTLEEENKLVLSENTSWPYLITLGDLQDSGLIDEVSNPKTDEYFSDSTLIYIDYVNSKYTFRIDENSINNALEIITLTGDKNYKVEINTAFTEPGYSAHINGVDITSNVTSKIYKNGIEVSNIDTSSLSNYTIQYKVNYVSEVDGMNQGIAIRRVKVVDTVAPILTCSSCSGEVIEIESVNSYDLPIISATDNSGEIVKVIKVGAFSSVIPGKKKIIYTATDSSGNTGKYELVVNVKDTISPIISDVTNYKDDNDTIIAVNAKDEGSGIKEYSFDGGITWQKSNKYYLNRYKNALSIQVKDYADNIATINYDLCYKEAILSGGYPILDSKMTAIYYDGTTPKVANVTSAWYSYQNKQWANAVILKNNPSKDYSVIDTVVDESDVVAYFVWIPRYSYTVKGSYGVNGTSASEPGYIDIKFINKKEKETGTATYTSTSPSNYRTQDGFTFGNEELVGLWVGKFETTGNDTTPTIKPNITSLRSKNVSTQFETAKKIGTNNGLTYETSMMKNDEWNAVAILSQSLYGRCKSTGTCEEISINNSASFITGSSAGKYGDSTTTGSTVYAYNTAQGITASTTFNITGIYDMSGGAWEYVMGVLLDENRKPIVASSGFTDLSLPNSKYYNVYTNSDRNTACNGKCYGLVETAGWYSDVAYMPSSSGPWVRRGGYFDGGVVAGAWGFRNGTGDANGNFSFRVVVRGA